MTLEELKAEAKAQGYCLMPIKETVKFVPCTCGCNRRRMWHKTGMIQYECMKCGKTSDWRKDEIMARLAWNRMIENERN